MKIDPLAEKYQMILEGLLQEDGMPLNPDAISNTGSVQEPEETSMVDENSPSKFNPQWQIVRVKAKEIKDPHKKLSYVMHFLHAHPTAANYSRVHNWVAMTALGYKNKNPEAAHLFKDKADSLSKQKEHYKSKADSSDDLSKYSKEDLKKVHSDLVKRKYGFQFKKTPKQHTAFVHKLGKHLSE